MVNKGIHLVKKNDLNKTRDSKCAFELYQAVKFRDLLIGDFFESYRSLSLKTLNMFKFFQSLKDQDLIDNAVMLFIINSDYRHARRVDNLWSTILLGLPVSLAHVPADWLSDY